MAAATLTNTKMVSRKTKTQRFHLYLVLSALLLRTTFRTVWQCICIIIFHLYNAHTTQHTYRTSGRTKSPMQTAPLSTPFVVFFLLLQLSVCFSFSFWHFHPSSLISFIYFPSSKCSLAHWYNGDAHCIPFEYQHYTECIESYSNTHISRIYAVWFGYFCPLAFTGCDNEIVRESAHSLAHKLQRAWYVYWCLFTADCRSSLLHLCFVLMHFRSAITM